MAVTADAAVLIMSHQIPLGIIPDTVTAETVETEAAQVMPATVKKAVTVDGDITAATAVTAQPAAIFFIRAATAAMAETLTEALRAAAEPADIRDRPTAQQELTKETVYISIGFIKT